MSFPTAETFQCTQSETVVNSFPKAEENYNTIQNTQKNHTTKRIEQI